jgi:NTP pyrophosphatase (non-canonical NTP hydrolase)
MIEGKAPTMFAIGSTVWPGISKLIEEAGEVIQVCGKLLGTGGQLEHWDGSSLKERLTEEIADLTAAIVFVVDKCGLDEEVIARRAGEKRRRFDRWHAAGDPAPTPSGDDR